MSSGDDHRIEAMLRRPGHPASSEGWWCQHKSRVAPLLVHLAAPAHSPLREGHERQVRNCRVCAVNYQLEKRYYKEFSPAGDPLAGDVLERLFVADCARLIPVLSNRASGRAVERLREEQRIAVVETLTSVELTLNPQVMRALNLLFRVWNPLAGPGALTKAQYHKLPGILALAVFGSDPVRQWAKAIAVELGVDPSVAPPGLALVVDRSVEALRDALEVIDVDASARNVDDMAKGLDCVVRTCPDDASTQLSHRHVDTKTSLLKIIASNKGHAIDVAARLLTRMARTMPAMVWKDKNFQSLDPRALLTTIQKQFAFMVSTPELRLSLLCLYEAFLRSMDMKRPDSRALIADQLSFIAGFCKRAPSHNQKSILFFSNESDGAKSLRLARRIAANVIMVAYEHCAPLPPFRNSTMLCGVVKGFLRDKQMTPVAIEVLAKVLLTDARNVVRAVVGSAHGSAVMGALAARPLRVDGGAQLTPETYKCDPSLLEDVWFGSRPVPWMSAVWEGFSKMENFKPFTPYSADAQRDMVQVFAEVHRVMGFLSEAWNVPGDIEFEKFHSEVVSTTLRPFVCVKMMHDSVLAALTTHKADKNRVWSRLLVRNCAHLLISARKEIRNAAGTFLQCVFRVQSTQDKLYHLLKAITENDDCAGILASGMLETTKTLCLLPMECVFDGMTAHITHYAAAFRALLTEYFLVLRQSQQILQKALLSYFSLNVSKSSKLVDYDLHVNRAVMGLSQIHNSLVEEGCESFTAHVYLLLPKIQFSGPLVKEALVRIVVELAKHSKLPPDLKPEYSSLVSSDSGLSRDQRKKVAKALDLKITYSPPRRRGNGDMLSAPPAFPVPNGPLPQFVKRNSPPSFHAAAVAAEHRKRQQALLNTGSRTMKIVDDKGRAVTPRAPLVTRTEVKKPEVRKFSALTPAERHVGKRKVSAYYAQLFKEDVALNPIPESHSYFQKAEQYSVMWTSILIREGRESIKQSIDLEEQYFQRLTSSQQRFMRVPFTVKSVEAVPSSTPPLQSVELVFAGKVRLRSYKSREPLDPNYEISGTQTGEVVRLAVEKGQPGASSSRYQSTGSGVTYAAVTHTKFGKNSVFTLELPKDENFSPECKGMHVHMSRVASMIPLQRQLDALWSTDALSERMLRTLLRPAEGWLAQKDPAKTEMDGVARALLKSNALNDSQARAISAVVRKVRRAKRMSTLQHNSRTKDKVKDNEGSFTLIQGPPGTGKTTTILALLSSIFSNKEGIIKNRMVEANTFVGKVMVPSFRVLVCAPSNAAVDEILDRVMAKGLPTASGVAMCPHVVRIGAHGKGPVEVKTLAKQDPLWTGSINLESNKEAEELKDVLENKQIQLESLFQGGKDLKSQIANCSDPLKLPHLRKALEDLEKERDEKKKARDELRGKVNALRKEEDDVFTSRNRDNTRAISLALNRASIVFSTLSGSAHDVMGHLVGYFDVVIIDEAAQCVEPDILIPFTGRSVKRMVSEKTQEGRPLSTECVLVGDPNQLPATVLCNALKDVCGKSLFERLATEGSDNYLLNQQYRMHPAICQFPSQRFYSGKLRCGPNVMEQSYHKAFHFDVRKRFGPVSLLNTTSAEARCGKSITNVGEANVVVDALNTLLRLYSDVEDIAVLSPYSAQVKLIKAKIGDIPRLRDASIEVSTVDGIQGREKSIVFLSTVRGFGGGIGFVKDFRRMNVALTRAKHAVVVVGNARALKAGSSDWAAFVERSPVHSALFPEARAAHVKPVTLPRHLPVLTAPWQEEPDSKPEDTLVRSPVAKRKASPPICEPAKRAKRAEIPVHVPTRERNVAATVKPLEVRAVKPSRQVAVPRRQVKRLEPEPVRKRSREMSNRSTRGGGAFKRPSETADRNEASQGSSKRPRQTEDARGMEPSSRNGRQPSGSRGIREERRKEPVSHHVPPQRRPLPTPRQTNGDNRPRDRGAPQQGSLQYRNEQRGDRRREPDRYQHYGHEQRAQYQESTRYPNDRHEPRAHRYQESTRRRDYGHEQRGYRSQESAQNQHYGHERRGRRYQEPGRDDRYGREQRGHAHQQRGGYYEPRQGPSGSQQPQWMNSSYIHQGPGRHNSAGAQHPRREPARREPARREPPRRDPPRREPPCREPPCREPPRRDPPRREAPRGEPPPRRGGLSLLDLAKNMANTSHNATAHHRK